nr:immunoglobulin light chain junction region [Macaca mulatta]MOW08619.1 immunoglobulin light chain junction region [Macaca mulatta]
CQQYNDLLPTF